ncbi:IS6 family transposase [Xenorhabdus bovienii]|uniref:IS6 family transposase n=1 Tax=Xenorhabdus bovienii TaxID=40576 RepID=A0AAJ1J7I6_XENBV|nr:IS6 family transposase [Xenorhabdus bovienii]MDE1478484.1 IS6 family transposase [Xenorhabdus bovienii]MDE1487686.1 IS6 family transposase [Xenorhabdus bovienii]MDE1491625.1 IS6 family transposase [Xenorhabdus bovienii]MDE9478580.1 IS6 family transposase [Xenorhabdus bovienii]MDE9510144.1 IS6 family transposase [Xenorhabdus bovienii]
MSLIRNVFKRLHYPVDIIAQCVREYLAYALSLRNLEEIMAERGIAVNHSTLSRWVHRWVPLIVKRYRRSQPEVERRWRMDETYIKIKGQGRYLYSAVDSGGNTVEFLLTAHRDKKAALRFFKKAMRQHGQPDGVTLDKSGANKAALDEINKEKPKNKQINIRKNKPLNNLIEQDHRNVKRRTRPVMGFKNFRGAQTLLAGIERVSMLRKGQYPQELEHPILSAAFFYQLTA